MHFLRREKHQETVRVSCPVCLGHLGTKRKDEIKSFNCAECKHTFYFYASNIKKPKGVKMIHTDTNCGCGRCGR